MKRISIEEHCFNEDFVEFLKSRQLTINKNEKIQFDLNKMKPEELSKLVDIGEGRLRQMDEDGIDMQVLSLCLPGVAIFDASTGKNLAKQSNDALAKAFTKYPDRFAGLATLPVQDPAAAAEELERAVRELGFKGTMIYSHVNGEFLDDQKYWAIFSRAEKLGVPIYLHPFGPPSDMIKPYLAFTGLSGAMLGYAHEVGLHALRLIFSGLFDKHPGLNIILGHLGEGLPFWLWRIENRWKRDVKMYNQATASKIIKTPAQYFKDNFFVTTSGMFSQPALSCVYQVLGADRILFAVDYPPESSKEAVAFLEAAPICDIDKEKIYHINAEKLLKL